MTALAYTRFELLRTVRSKRFFILSLGFPLGIYLLMAGPSRDVADLRGTGIPAALYYMIGLATFGTMAGVLSSGTRIAAERTAGWTRQLRLTPLPARAYLRAKVATGYLMALLTLALLFLAGSLLGVRLSSEQWLHMTALMLVGLIPFAALGIWLGHVLTVDAVGPAVGATTAALSFVSGTWYPLGDGLLAHVAHWLPSYWLVQASRAALTGDGWPAQGWLVIGAWSVALGALAARAYRRNTQRV
ncbi:MAG TPA: ABC transporter permease [Kofleriaceae bacterium]|jgi:ABC-2 type transport system permease protein|nr:ABC transporter permease [Kofleriaceae bacterium]